MNRAVSGHCAAGGADRCVVGSLGTEMMRNANKFVYIVFNSAGISRAPRPKGGHRLRTATRPFLPVVSSDQSTLQRVLALAAHPDVKLLLDGRTLSIPALTALRLARSGRYDWSGTPRRVRKMRPIQTHRWQACYRTTGAATLQPSVEWLHSTTHRFE